MLLAALLLASAPAEPDAAPITLRDALVLPSVGGTGRTPIHTDAVEALLVRGAFVAPAEGDEVTLPDGSARAWRRATAGDDGWLAGGEMRGGWAHWTVDRAAEEILILDASGHEMVFVNGAPRAGDVYQNGWVQLPVQLRAGGNDLLFRAGRGRLRAQLVAPPAPAFFSLREPTLPTLIEGEADAVLAGVVVVNATNEARTDLAVRASGDGLPALETRVPRIEPLTIRKVPVRVGGPPPAERRACTVALELLEDDAGGAPHVLHRAEVALDVRRADERHRRTFLSDADGSVQYYAVTPALAAGDAAERPALILTLHGAGIEGSGQAAVYAPKQWAHVVAPTNRRPFGFDWEDWGRRDAIEVLDLASARLGTDPRRTYLTGHSMGGHGTWHLGATFASRFAAIGPSAGWRSFFSYGGAEEAAAPEGVDAMMARAANPSRTERLTRNLIGRGVYVLHGEKDDNVPADEARFMVAHLRAFHADVEHHEEPGAGHWWGDQCCDWPPMMAFFAARRLPTREEVASIELHTANPAISSAAEWLVVEQQERSGDFSSARATLGAAGTTRRIDVETSNVRRLALDLRHLSAADLEARIDGTVLAPLDPAAVLHFAREGAVWRAATGPVPAAEKGPHRAGPFKEAFAHRAILVYGTRGTSDERDWAQGKARFDAETFWYRGNGVFDVVPDDDFDPRAEPDRSVILYGNAETNGAWAALLADAPVQATRGVLAVRGAGAPLRGDDLACLFIRPRPGSDRALVAVVGGTGLAGMRATNRLRTFTSGVAYPDLIVIGAEALAGGAAGVRMAGWFGYDWSVENGESASRSVP
jgi:poly(3-hydroxybutyrate) depolymerase